MAKAKRPSKKTQKIQKRQQEIAKNQKGTMPKFSAGPLYK